MKNLALSKYNTQVIQITQVKRAQVVQAALNTQVIQVIHVTQAS